MIGQSSKAKEKTGETEGEADLQMQDTGGPARLLPWARLLRRRSKPAAPKSGVSEAGGGLLSDLARETRGTVLVLVAAAAIPLVGFIGIATDAARGYIVKSRLSSAIDAAALAGGWAYFEDHRDADVRMYFGANFPPGYMNATVNGPIIVADEIAETLTVSAGAEIPTTFMALFGMDSLSVSAEAEVTRRMTALDLVLAIDMSGSMRNSASGGGSRISAARTAAKDLVDILFGSHAAKDFLNVGVVPWSAKVNVTLDGSDYYHWENRAEPSPTFVNPLTGAVQSQVWYASNSPVPFLSEPDDDWDGCVYNRYTDDGVDTNDADMLMGATTAGTTDWPAYEPVGPEGEPVSGWGRCTLAVDGNECQRCLSEGITPLTNQKSQVIAAIDSLTSPNGTTNIPLGLAWGWEVVSPEAPFDQAVADPDYDRVQAIVLLTDGENYAGSGDGYKGVWGLGYRGNDEMNERLLLVADSIKASGVEIYAIQFANGSGALANLMRDVASEEGSPYYHYAPDRDALRSVFREVANHLSELRLSR